VACPKARPDPDVMLVRSFSTTSRPALRAASGRPPARRRHDGHRRDRPHPPSGPEAIAATPELVGRSQPTRDRTIEQLLMACWCSRGSTRNGARMHLAEGLDGATPNTASVRGGVISKMTLILCLGNEDQMVLVSDRRRSFVGRPPDEESNKALVVNLLDARVAVAFTGLAGTPSFQTRYWLAEALSEAARPEPLLEPTMAHFRDIASRDIKNVALSAQDDPSVKRLTIFVAGYQYSDERPRPWFFRVSNFEGEELYPKPKQLPDDDFSLVWARGQKPATVPYRFVVAGGTTRGIPSGSITQLQRLVAERKPPRALVDKAVKSSRLPLRRLAHQTRLASNARVLCFQRIPQSPPNLNITQPTWLDRCSCQAT
jgi:hypothetical protein